MKKRLFSLVLALTLCMGLMIPASAEETVSVVWLDDDLVPSGSLGFDDGMMGVRRNEGAYQYGFVDQTGKLVIPLQYSEVKDFTEGLAPVSRPRESGVGWDLWGYIDKTGKEVIPCIYESADNFFEGLAAVEILSEDGEFRYGYIDKTGKVVIPFEYDFGRGFIDGYAAVRKNGKWGYINKSGEVVIPFEYGLTGLGFSNGLAEVYKNGKWGLINENNEFVIPPELKYFDILYCPEWDMLQVRRGNYGDFDCGFIDRDGTVKIPLIYDACYGVSEGLSAARFGPICGFLDKDGEWAIPFLYSEVSPFFEGLAAVKQDGKAGYINKAGEVVIPFEYDEAYSFSDGVALVEKDGRFGILSRTPVSSTPPVSTVGGFSDVKESDYFADAVLWAVEKNITSGTSKTTFSPNATCSKAQILSFLWRAHGSPEPTAANPFTDIKTTDYFYKAALWAAEKGLVSGSTFGANTDCTRAMTMEYMWKAAGSPTPAGKADFTDVPANADYAQAVAWAVENKITSGTGSDNFSPAATCTRGQIVTFLHRAMGK